MEYLLVDQDYSTFGGGLVGEGAKKLSVIIDRGLYSNIFYKKLPVVTNGSVYSNISDESLMFSNYPGGSFDNANFPTWKRKHDSGGIGGISVGAIGYRGTLKRRIAMIPVVQEPGHEKAVAVSRSPLRRDGIKIPTKIGGRRKPKWKRNKVCFNRDSIGRFEEDINNRDDRDILADSGAGVRLQIDLSETTEPNGVSQAGNVDDDPDGVFGLVDGLDPDGGNGYPSDGFEHSGTRSIEHSCGPMNGICHFCRAMFFQGERINRRYTKCCRMGKVTLPPLCDLPAYLKELFEGTTTRSRKFIINSLVYNNSLTCASTGVNYRKLDRPGPLCLTVNGQIQHYGVPLMAEPNCQPKFAQLYFINPADSATIRAGYGDGMDPEILNNLSNIFKETNFFVRSYAMLKEVMEKEEEESGRLCDRVRMHFVNDVSYSNNAMRNRTMSERNAIPGTDEVACVFHHYDGTPPYSRDIQIYPRGKHPTKISPYNGICDAMSYILLFPDGTDKGWSFEMKKDRGVSLMNYYSYRLAIRSSNFNQLLRAGNLTGQYMIDAYLKIEADRLKFISNNQKEIRAETYAGIHDFVNGAAERAGASIGKKIILPSSFIGSNRNMYLRYLNSMKLVSTFGHPDLFITVTCNPRWFDITDNLQFNGQSPFQRWDLVARVFKIKLDAIMDDLKNKKMFGDVVAWNYTIEFQKRGLPHCHMLVYLREKIRTPERVEQYISAELPIGPDGQELQKIILRHNIHGPCGEHNSKAACMVDGVCVKKFPKDFRSETEMNEKGYPKYRRRNLGSFRVGKYYLDNGWIVPFSPKLSLKYNCHINVEVCSSAKAAKYINKYTNKQGYDCCTLSVSSSGDQRLDYDEIRCFLNMRYVGAAEAMWRILSYKMFDTSHPVLVLAVHLPDQNIVRFEVGHEMEALEGCRETTLTQWFKLNATDASARNLFYHEVSGFYSYNKSMRKWIKRGNKLGCPQLSRMGMVSVQDIERFALRLLLLHKKGATSFENLRTVETDEGRKIFSTFREAAVASGLLIDGREIDLCIQEAIDVKMPRQLRSLFGLILAHCKPANAPSLWEKYKEHFTDDFLRDTGNADLSERMALTDINHELMSSNSLFTLSSFGFDPSLYTIESDSHSVELETPGHFDDISDTLNDSQKSVFHIVINASMGARADSGLFYLDGPGGTGKTYLYNVLIRQLEVMGKKVIAMAMTGLAATLLKDGLTVHRAFSVPVNERNINCTTLSRASTEGVAVLNADVIIVDEATLMSCTLLWWINLTLQDIMGTREPFGGKIVLLGGDFRQCLPIIPKSRRSRIVGSCLKASPIWGLFNQLYLTVNMRSRESSPEFSAWLLAVGSGQLGEKITIPTKYVTNSELELIQNIFGGFLHPDYSEEIAKRSILCTTNDTVERMNSLILNAFVGISRTYFSNDVPTVEDGTDANMRFPQEDLHKIITSGLPPHALTLKIGVPVILIRNLDIKKKLCNGTKLIVTRMFPNTIEVRRVDGYQRILIPRIPITESDPELPCIITRHQFPFRLAFSLTINKSQGQTFDYVGLHLTKQVFAHGQLYVGLSRVRDDNKLFIYSPGGEDNTIMNNVVYAEVFT